MPTNEHDRRTEEHSSAEGASKIRNTPGSLGSHNLETPSRSEVERFARWLIANGVEIAWTFHRGTKGADKSKLDADFPRELEPATDYLETRLQRANVVVPAAASSLFLVDGDTPELAEDVRRIAGVPTFEFLTGSGNTGLVYRAPEGVEQHVLRFKQGSGILEAVSDGYLVAPCSVHPDTGELYWQSNELAPAELTREQVAELVALASGSSSNGSSSSPLEAALEDGAEPSSRHDADYLEACRLWRDFPDTDDSSAHVLELVSTFSATHSKGARSTREIRADVRRARNYMREVGSIGADVGREYSGGIAPGESERESVAPFSVPERGLIRDVVELVGPTSEVPDSTLVLAVLVMLSAVVGWRRVLSGFGESVEPCNIFAVIAGGSAVSRKTTGGTSAESLFRDAGTELSIERMSHVSGRELGV